MRRLTWRLAEFAGTLDGIAFINPHDRQGIYNLKEIVDWAEDFYLYKIANRLAAYEDTGLMPEEITELQAEAERLRGMVKSITGGLDEAIEANQYLGKQLDKAIEDIEILCTKHYELADDYDKLADVCQDFCLHTEGKCFEAAADNRNRCKKFRWRG